MIILKNTILTLIIPKHQLLNTSLNLKKNSIIHIMDFFHLNINFGVAQVDFGDCSFIEKGNKVYGKYCVLSFTHYNKNINISFIFCIL